MSMYGREALRLLREKQAAPQEEHQATLLDGIPADAPMDDATLTVWNGERWVAWDKWLATAPILRDETPPKPEYDFLKRARKTAIPRGEEKVIQSGNPAKWVGSLWQGLYQCMTAIFDGALMFGVGEWQQIRDEVTRIEVVDGDWLLYSCTGDDARKHGYERPTPNGQRFAIPVRAWCKHGTDDAPTCVAGACGGTKIWLVKDGERWLMYVGSRNAGARRRNFATPYVEHAIRTAEQWYGAAGVWRAEKARDGRANETADLPPQDSTVEKGTGERRYDDLDLGG